MIFPCRLYDKDGNLIKEYSVKELTELHWKDNPLYTNFSEGAHQSIRYAERTDTNIADYIPTSDLHIKSPARANKSDGNLMIKELKG